MVAIGKKNIALFVHHVEDQYTVTITTARSQPVGGASEKSQLELCSLIATKKSAIKLSVGDILLRYMSFTPVSNWIANGT